MYIVMFGAPGSGKGTVAKILAKKTNLPHISTGDMFRQQIKKQTELGKLADSYMSKGNLVPDEVTIDIVADRLTWEDAKNGAILDGFPRTLEQAQALDKILAKMGKKVDIVPELKVPTQIIVERILNRATCSNKECGAIYNTKFKPPKEPGICDICGSELITRTDDNEQTIQKRLEVYENNSKDLIQYYQEKQVLYTVCPDDPTKDNAAEQVAQKIVSNRGRLLNGHFCPLGTDVKIYCKKALECLIGTINS